MWKEPLQIGKRTESDYAYDSKIVYCMANYNDEYGQMTVKDFADNFEEKLKEVDFEWKHKKKDGTPRYPSYKQIKNKWWKLYKWAECATVYAEDKKGPELEKAILIFDKKILKDTITDFKTIDSHQERIKQLRLQEKLEGVDNTYKIARLEETINSIWHRIKERLGLDKENLDVNFTGDIAAKVDKDVTSDDFMKAQLEYGKQLIEAVRK